METEVRGKTQGTKFLLCGKGEWGPQVGSGEAGVNGAGASLALMWWFGTGVEIGGGEQ